MNVGAASSAFIELDFKEISFLFCYLNHKKCPASVNTRNCRPGKIDIRCTIGFDYINFYETILVLWNDRFTPIKCTVKNLFVIS